ncbi:hypothetical protein MKW92_035133 [Papaver armeniacum]|nr:hypothetical protein MKW92_035133 [Papaver armeniacum]
MLLRRNKRIYKSKEEEEIVVVPMVKESKNAKRSKKKFVNKDDAETPELLQVHNQASIKCVMEDSQSEEVANCPERAAESVAVSIEGSQKSFMKMRSANLRRKLHQVILWNQRKSWRRKKNRSKPESQERF